MYYVKKNSIVEAIKYTGDPLNIAEIKAFCGTKYIKGKEPLYKYWRRSSNKGPVIKTSYGIVVVKLNDYIVKTKNDLYCIDSTEFEELYERSYALTNYFEGDRY